MKRSSWVSIIPIILLSVMVLINSPVFAQNDLDNDGLADSSEQEIASRFAPNLQFVAGEKFFPIGVEYHISNSILKLKSTGGDQVISSSPTIEEISNFPSGDYYLDNRLGGLDEIYSDYSAKKESLSPMIYSRVSPGYDPGRDTIVVQYWFFYAFNEGPLNEHEGDWEMIQVVLDQSGSNPISASYSQHLSGQTAVWNDVEKTDGTHPIVYVAMGSHANYFRSYQGNFGFESDIVGGNGELIQHDRFEIILLGEPGLGNRPASQGWLDFGGRWGDWALFSDAIRGTAGPPGPAQGDNMAKWTGGVAWGSNLRSLDSSLLMINLVVANFIPIFGVVIVVLSIVKIRGIYGMRKEGFAISSILRSRAAVGVVLGIVGIILTVGAIISPWYSVLGDIQSEEIRTEGAVNLILIDGFNGLQVNTLQEGQGLNPVFNLAIPLAIVMLVSVIFSVLDIFGSKGSKHLGSKFIRSGISNLVPVVVIIIFILQLGTLLNSVSTIGGFEVGPEIRDFADQISTTPIQGEYATSIQSYGTIDLTWGLELGSYLFIGAFIVKLLAGAITRSFRIPKEES